MIVAGIDLSPLQPCPSDRPLLHLTPQRIQILLVVLDVYFHIWALFLMLDLVQHIRTVSAAVATADRIVEIGQCLSYFNHLLKGEFPAISELLCYILRFFPQG